jgi:triphosphoribosyl-dephospho-CoA synthase
MLPFDKAKHISKCLQTAILLEVTANKPGNVNLTVGFEGTQVEHFLASAVAASAALEEAAKRGLAVQNGALKPSQLGMGELMRECVADIDAWQTGGNTLLGTVMLFVPLAAAAGMTPMTVGGVFDLPTLRANLKLAVEATTAQDAVDLYEAIAIASPTGLNEAPELDVNDAQSKERLLKDDVSLFKVFQIAAGYDDICYEWVNNFPITFDAAYPYLTGQLKKTSLSVAIVHTFLKVLSERPDTFISRKVGLENARKVSDNAGKILQAGGVETAEGRESMVQFDQTLRTQGNDYNPGTTADITSATLGLLILSGYRP